MDMFHTKTLTPFNIITQMYKTKTVTGTFVNYTDAYKENDPSANHYRSYRSDEIDKSVLCIASCDTIQIPYNNDPGMEGYWWGFNHVRTS